MASERILNILKSVNDKVQRLMAVDRFYVALFDPVRAELEFPWVAWRGKLIKANRAPWKRRAYQGDAWLTDAVVAQKTTLLLEKDLQVELQEKGLEYWPDGKLPLSWLGAPMVFEDRVVGVLVVENRDRARAFGDSGVRVLSTVARQAVMAIENARLYERLDRKIANLRAVNEVGRRLTSGIRLSEPEILELIYEQATPLMDTSDMYIALYDPDPDRPDEYDPDEPEKSIVHGTVRFGLARDNGRQVDTEQEEGWGPRRADDKPGLTEYVIRTRKAHRPEDVVKAYETYATEHIGKIPRSWMGVPMMAENEVLGVVVLRNDEYENVYDEDDEEVLQAIAGQAAVAIDNARLLDRETRWARQLAALQEIGVKITSELDLDKVLESIVENANSIASADFSTLFIYDSEQDKFERGIRKGSVEIKPSVPSNTGLAARIAKTQKAVFAEDAEKEPGVKPTFIEEKKIRSFAGLPLMIRGRTVGVLYVNFFEPRGFSEEERKPILLLANQAAVAIENARLYAEMDEELQVSRERIRIAEQVILANSFTMDILHRIPNLVGSIPVRAETALRKIDRKNALDDIDTEIISQLEGIRKDAERLMHSVKQWRPLEESQRKKLTDVEMLLNSALTHVLIPENVESEFAVQGGLPYVYCNPRQLFESFRCIIENGIQAMYPDGGMLSVEAAPEHKTGDIWINISITDTGGGISPENLPRVFDLFFTTKPSGSGYGLWRARSVVQSIGGTIQARSDLGKGTTFAITLPGTATRGGERDE